MGILATPSRQNRSQAWFHKDGTSFPDVKGPRLGECERWTKVFMVKKPGFFHGFKGAHAIYHGFVLGNSFQSMFYASSGCFMQFHVTYIQNSEMSMYFCIIYIPGSSNCVKCVPLLTTKNEILHPQTLHVWSIYPHLDRLGGECIKGN